VPSKHKNISKYLRSGFFEGIKTFRDFEARTDELCANSTEVGDTLEILVEAYLSLKLNPVLWAKDVWLVGDVPLKIRTELNLPSGTKGIDGVYLDPEGNLVPYQVKYRTDKETLPYGEVSSFLGLTEKSLQGRIIFTNARRLSDDTISREGIRSVCAAKFHDLTENDFQKIYAWLTNKSTNSEEKPRIRRPHQDEAVKRITAELKVANRTTAVMACGTGKTMVALWAAEDQEPNTVLVLVPSLALLSQTLPDWCKYNKWGDRFRRLCVCSDASVDQSAKNDEYALNQSDLEFSVTTKVQDVQNFLAKNQTGVNVIFSTYQSAEVVAEALKGKTIDFAIFDEAHKTTGPKEGLFAFGLSDKNISIKKRLFLTATPRHYDMRKRDKDGDFRTISMNDLEVYGKVSYRLSFSAAVVANIIVPYKVIISLSLNKDVDDELLRQGSTLVRRSQIQAKWVANQIALKRAIAKTSASKIITFHSRVKLAKEFAGDDSRGFSEHVKGFDVFHVNGEQNAADRKAKLDEFKRSSKSLITNARCLTEGVDVPAVDMVAFVDPRKSKIDIAQAAGRAMRQSKSTKKKLGYIAVPLFIEQKKGETESEALNRSGFDEVAQVLNAMLENDEDLIDIISEIQKARGRGEKFNPRQLLDKIEVIGPEIDLDELTNSIGVKIVDRLGFSWDFYFGLLQKYYKEYTHCRVPAKYLKDGYKLGGWVSNQRKNYSNKQLSEERIKQLESLEFIWDPYLQDWEEGFAILKNYREKFGHCRVLISYTVKDYNLGTWVNTQRQNKQQLSHDRIKRLDALKFIWDPIEQDWEEGYDTLKKFYNQFGHCRVPLSYYLDGYRLGGWVSHQRRGWKRRQSGGKKQISEDRIKQLDSLGFIWDPMEQDWEDGYEALKKYFDKHHNCNLNINYVINNFQLGKWLNRQRQSYKAKKLSEGRIKRLEILRVIWNPLSQDWENGYSALKLFKKQFGHCRVPKSYNKEGYNLGLWVVHQRSAWKRRQTGGDKQLSDDRIKRLDDLQFTWDTKQDKWEKNYLVLKKYHKIHGDCMVPQRLKMDGVNLGVWVGHQRRDYDDKQLSQNRIKSLETLGFIWNTRGDNWEKGYLNLIKYHKQHKNCWVPSRYAANGFNLGIWVGHQRRNYKKKQLSKERIKRLESLGFGWDNLSQWWEESFTALQEFKKKFGHCRVTESYRVKGISLGRWVGTQRYQRNRKELSEDRIKRLNSLDFPWKI